MTKAYIAKKNPNSPTSRARRRQSAGIAPPPDFLSTIAAQDRVRRLLRYEVIGKLVTLDTPRGSIEFPRETGPGLGVAEDGSEFLFISSWAPLPELKEYSEEFCSSCLVQCDICGGSGTSLCVHLGCGGAGQIVAGLDGCGCGADAACERCGGSGNVAILRVCPNCRGTGKAQCGPCHGTGKLPTGKAPDGETCAQCRGTLRGGKWQAQDLHSLIAGKLGNYIAIGPVVRLIVKLPNGLSRQSPIRAIDFSQSDGMMVLLPIDQGTDPPAYFWRQRGDGR